mgnify:CR=1 FL=1
MAMYFCDYHQCFHDDDWIPMEGDHLCGEALEDRQEAREELSRAESENHITNTERRHGK